MMDSIKCIICDFANTLSNSHFFNTRPEKCLNWYSLFQEYIFSDKIILSDWCKGKITAIQIAEYMKTFIPWTSEDIYEEMKNGCVNILFNPSLYSFINTIHRSTKTALVTNNIDLFSEIIVAHYNLSDSFDCIINSADHGTDNKVELWKLALNKIEKSISFKDCLLIEDGEKWPKTFEDLGGNAYRYTTDIEFERWLGNNQEFLEKEKISERAKR